MNTHTLDIEAGAKASGERTAQRLGELIEIMWDDPEVERTYATGLNFALGNHAQLAHSLNRHTCALRAYIGELHRTLDELKHAQAQNASAATR